MQNPCLGYTVNPRMVTANGTSLLHGMAALAINMHTWHWAFNTEHPSFSQRTPMHPKGKRHGAEGLQQHCKLQQQTPACKRVGCQSVSRTERIRISMWTNSLPYLSAASSAITIGVNTNVKAACGTAQNNVLFVYGVVTGHDSEAVAVVKNEDRGSLVFL